MNTSIQNLTILCPPQSDSPLDVAASWIGIITFITTTLGGLTIFYTLYKAFEQAQEDILEFSKALSKSTNEFISDIETMEPILQGLAHGSQENRVVRDVMDLIVQSRSLTSELDAALKLGFPSANTKGLFRAMAIYRLGQSPVAKNKIRDIQQIGPGLQAMKINLILMHLNEQDKILHKLVKGPTIQGVNGNDIDTTTETG